jgi:hypothetical protein
MTVATWFALDTAASAPAKRAPRPGLSRKHVLMLALAIEVLAFGVSRAERYQPPGILVEEPVVAGHRVV